MKSEDLYTAAFLTVLPICLERSYRISPNKGQPAVIQTAVDEAHDIAVAAAKKWLAEKEESRRRGGLPE